MKATSMYIYLEGVRFFGHHGVDPQETIVGVTRNKVNSTAVFITFASYEKKDS